jgi:2-haloacid dehalogenase
MEMWQSKQLQYAWMSTLTAKFQPFSDLSIRALNYVAKINGISLTQEHIKTISEQQQKMEPFPDVKRGLEKIQALGSAAKLVILTNGSKQQTEKLLANAKLRNYFEEIISVESVQRYKPAPAPYLKAAEILNIPIGQIMLVSSNLWDIAGAQAADMKTCWVNREKGGIVNDEIDIKPAYTVSSIEDIIDILQWKDATA